jgi:hypothetical protein
MKINVNAIKIEENKVAVTVAIFSYAPILKSFSFDSKYSMTSCFNSA